MWPLGLDCRLVSENYVSETFRARKVSDSMITCEVGADVSFQQRGVGEGFILDIEYDVIHMKSYCIVHIILYDVTFYMCTSLSLYLSLSIYIYT